MNPQALRELAQALPPGAALPVPREWLLELLEAVQGTDAPSAAAAPPPALTAAELAARFGRRPATIREWCERGVFAHAHRFRGREWRVPLADVLALEEQEQGRGSGPGTTRARRTRTTSLQRLLKPRRSA